MTYVCVLFITGGDFELGLGIGVGEFLDWQDAAQSGAEEDGPECVVRHPQNALVFPWNGQEGERFGYTVEETFMPYKLKMISM